jgi:hypothetical protein
MIIKYYLLVLFGSFVSLIGLAYIVHAQESPPDCGISATDINFDSLNPDETSGEEYTTITNIGTLATTSLTIKGTDWSGNPSGSMDVGQTHWSLDSGKDYTTEMTPLATSESSSIGTVSVGYPLTVYFKLAIPAGQPVADYSQTITFTSSC